MALPVFKSSLQELMLLQNSWTPQLNPLLASPITSGLLLPNLPLSTGPNSINHKLGRKYQGWIITGLHGVYIQVYDTPSTMPDLTLVLNASAPGNIDLYVF